MVAIEKISENAMIESDFDGLSDWDIAVLLIVDGDRIVSKTRLQKYLLIYTKISEKRESFLWGYSDDVDEAAVNLSDMGILKTDKGGYTLTEYGRKLRQFILEEYEDEDQIKLIRNIKTALVCVPDKNLTGLAYRFYGNAALHPTLAGSVIRFNTVWCYDGITLADYNKVDFEQKLRVGDVITCDARE